MVGVESELVTQNIAVSLTSQIEISMLSQIDGSRFIGRGFSAEFDLAGEARIHLAAFPRAHSHPRCRRGASAWILP